MSHSPTSGTCPDQALLRSLLDGTLTEPEMTIVQTHVDRCSLCEAALRQMTTGGESWIGVAARLKESPAEVAGESPMMAAMDRLKNEDSDDGAIEQVDPQKTLDFLEPADDPKLLGKLGRHEISEVVGWGGMGVVLKAYDPSLHRVVAVKVLASHLAHHAVARKRFIREAQAAAAVCHDNVVTIHAIDETGPQPKIVMQFVAGGSLQERIDQEAPLELKEILRIAMQTAAGLAAAHAQGVVHRDVKPANILLENGVQRVKLTDFGLARVMDDASLTLSGVIAGTPQYMAPEQAWGRDVDARADLFSLGAVMYAMCSGHSPFRARTTMAVLRRVCEDNPRTLRAINPDIPEWLVAIIEKLLVKKPENRFQSATEVSELLGRWLAYVQQPSVVDRPPLVETISDSDALATSDMKLAGQIADQSQETSDSATVPAIWLAAFVIGMVPMFAAGQVSAHRELAFAGLGQEATSALLRVIAIACWCLIPGLHWLWKKFDQESRVDRRESPAPNRTAASLLAMPQLQSRPDELRHRLRNIGPTIIVAGVFVIPALLFVLSNLATPHQWTPATAFRHAAAAVMAIVGGLLSLGLLSRWLTGEAKQPRHVRTATEDSLSSGTPVESANDRWQIGIKHLLWPMLVTGTLLGTMLVLIIAETGTRNLNSFVGFSLFHLAATFAMASAFRTAWNTSSWIVWFGIILFLPATASAFGWAASYQDAPPAADLLCGMQLILAVAFWFGLLFIRPLFIQSSERSTRGQFAGTRRLIAIAGLVLLGTPLVLLLAYLLSNTSDTEVQIPMSPYRFTDDPIPTYEPNRSDPPADVFPKPQFLSTRRASTSHNDETEPIELNPSNVDSIPEELNGRWVVLTLQGDDPPRSAGSSSGGMSGGFGGMMPNVVPAATTPMSDDHLQFLQFQNGDLLLSNDHRPLRASVVRGRELHLADDQQLQFVLHGVFSVAGDRLVICWSAANSPLPRNFRPKAGEQLLVCRREWSRPSTQDANGNAVIEKLGPNSKVPKAEMPFSPREANELQQAWAEKVSSPVEVTNSIGMKLRVIPPGTFGDARGGRQFAGDSGSGAMMGTGSGVSAFGGTPSPPAAEVGTAVRGPIMAGVYEVTVGQFRQFVEDSKYVTERERGEKAGSAKPHSWRNPEIEQTSEEQPVVNVTFVDALAFCHWLSLKEEKPYRLLTRREWEFCARAGSWLPVTLGPGKLAYRSQFFTTTAPIGSYSANSFGLHDFIGNAAEWAWQSDIPENDPRRKEPPTAYLPFSNYDPSVFCGGDFRHHIDRSQPGEWRHPTATPNLPMIGFRVAVDLSEQSFVQLSKYWPPQQLMLAQEIVRVRQHPTPSADNKDPEAKPSDELRHVVWLEMLVQSELLPYSVEWLDFEVQRLAWSEGGSGDDLQFAQVMESNDHWQTVPLNDALRLLEQTDFDPEPVSPDVTNPVLTMPIPKAVEGRWGPHWFDPGQGRHSELKGPPAKTPAFQFPQLLRFIDFHPPQGKYRYRVRLKYQIPGVISETIQATAWYFSDNTANIDLDQFDKPQSPQMPVIELKPPAPADPASKPSTPRRFGNHHPPAAAEKRR